MIVRNACVFPANNTGFHQSETKILNKMVAVNICQIICAWKLFVGHLKLGTFKKWSEIIGKLLLFLALGKISSSARFENGLYLEVHWNF